MNWRLRLLPLLVAAGCRSRHAHHAPVDAERLFEQTCASCHGADGRGDTPVGRDVGARDLTAEAARRKPDSELRHQIVVGKGKMPGFGDALDEVEIEALVDHVRRLQSAKR
jgi:mono/diheme cytochrome c family protein